MNAYPDWLGLREIDRRAGTAKGRAFRAFKALEPQLAEGRDYRLLDPDAEAALAAELRRSGRVYPSSVRILLLAPATAERVLAALRADGGPASR